MKCVDTPDVGDGAEHQWNYSIGMTTPTHPMNGPVTIAESSFRKLLSIMRAVGLKVLKNKLSEYVRLAAGGETVLVTDRDRVVAELIPPREGRSAMVADARLAEAVRLGWITPPVMVAGGAPAHVPVATLACLLDELARDRGDR